MRKYLLILPLLIMAFSLLAQDPHKNDSLLRVLKASKEDTNKANVLIALCKNNLDYDNKAVAVYAEQLSTLSNKLNFGVGIADAYNFLGIVEDDKSNFSKALDLYNKSLEYALKYKLDRKSASIRNNIGLIYWKIGDHQKGLRLYFDALKVFEKLNEKKLQANVLSNIGLIYSELHQHKKSLYFQRRALALRVETGDKYGLATTYNNISKTFSHMSTEDSSIHFAKLALAIQEEMKDEYGLAISYANIGLSFMNAKVYDSAIIYLERSIVIRDTIDDKLGSIFSYRALGNAYRLQGQPAKSLVYLEQALKIAKDIGAKERIGNVSETLALSYQALGDYKKAYYAMQVFATFLREQYDTLSTRQASELAVKYEVEKKDLLIEKDKIELQRRQSVIANKTLALRQRNMQLALLGILLLATGGTSYLLYNRYKWKQEAKLQQELIKQQDIASKAIIEAEEQERKRIAGDLHDGIGQLCSAIKMNLSGLDRQLSFPDRDTALAYEKTLAMVDEACKEIRVISHQMMPNVLLKYGLSTALRDFLDKIDGRRLQVNLETFGLQERLDSNVETVLYRVIQEAVNNVIKHSGANTLYIQLNKDEDSITVTIEDNGKGFDTADAEKFEGIGLKNIRSRVEYLKGTVEFDSAIGRGTVVSVWVPLA